MRKFYTTILQKQNLALFFLVFILAFIVDEFRYFFILDARIDLEDRRWALEIFRDFKNAFLINIAIFGILYIFFKSIFNRVVKFFAIINILLFFINTFLIFKFKITFSTVAIDSFLNTNPEETSEFLSAYADYGFIIFLIACILLSYAIIKFKWGGGVSATLNTKKPALFTVLYICILLIFVITNLFKDQKLISILMSKHQTTQAVYSIIVYAKQSEDPTKIKTIIASKIQSETPNISRKIPNVVLIIGESVNRNYMQIYGYDKPNTPIFADLVRSDNAIVFTDTISPNVSTNLSLQKVLNFSSYETQKPWYDSLNVVDLMRLGGYRSTWISNQRELNSMSFPISRYVAARADSMHFVSRDVINAKLIDEEILPLLDNEISIGGDLKFYIIHLNGSHVKYALRYPHKFDKFSKNDMYTHAAKDIKHTQNESKTTAEYLNSIFYTDWVLGEIYHRFENKNTIIIYLSDHAESVYDYNGIFGHGFVSPYVLEIPLVFLASDKFKTIYPDIWERLKIAKDKPFMSDDLIHTIADLVGIKVSEFNPVKSLLNKDFDITRKRIINDTDYDRLR